MGKTRLFGERYRVDSHRMRGWNYGIGTYFVTICTKWRAPWFGKIRDESMHLSDIGRIVDDEWRKTTHIRPYVTLDAHIIMPDHFHGIIRIHMRGDGPGVVRGDGPGVVRGDGPGVVRGVEAPWHGASTKNPFHKPQWKSGSLGAIIHHFKRACTIRIRNAGHPDFAWQSRFHDRIIRNNDALAKIRRYIMNNPRKWTGDGGGV